MSNYHEKTRKDLEEALQTAADQMDAWADDLTVVLDRMLEAMDEEEFHEERFSLERIRYELARFAAMARAVADADKASEEDVVGEGGSVQIGGRSFAGIDEEHLDAVLEVLHKYGTRDF